MRRLRTSNFELLRLPAILAVVLGHFIRQSGLVDTATGANAVINTVLGSCGRISVNVFLILGSWFMVDAPFRPGQIVKLYLEVVFYSIPITLLMIAISVVGLSVFLVAAITIIDCFRIKVFEIAEARLAKGPTQ